MLNDLQREYYQQNPHFWIRDRLKIPLETMDWTLIPEYKSKSYVDENGNLNLDKWDGTANPILEILKGLTTHRRIGVESATGTGKTFIAACAVLWFLDCFGEPNDEDIGCLVVTVASKEEQVKKILWKEIHRLWPKFQVLHPQAEILTMEIRMRPDRKNWFATGWSVGTGQDEAAAVRAQGFHDVHMLYIVDETPGVPLSVMEAIINTSSAPHNLILCLGNPNDVEDSLHNLCLLSTTKHIRMSAYDHPNVVTENGNFIPGAVSQESIDERRIRYKTENSALYLSRVRGICPDMDDRCLFEPEAMAMAEHFIKQPEELIKFPWKFEDENKKLRIIGRRSEGTIKIYDQPRDTHLNRYLFFADVAGDAGRGDAHACIVFDRVWKRPAALIHMRGPREEYIQAILKLTERFTIPWKNMGEGAKCYPMLAWEKTGGAGSFILDDRIKVYPNLYFGRNTEIIDPNIRAAAGWDTTSRTRADIINALQEFGLELFEKPYLVVDETLFDEMRTFVWVAKGRGGRYEAKKGKFDDVVIALGASLVIDKLLPSPVPQGDGAIRNRNELSLFERRQRNRMVESSWAPSVESSWSSYKLTDKF